MHTPVSLRSLFLSAAAACALAACGGGSDDSPPPPPPPPPGVTLSGVAATGAPLVGATVDAKCNGSSGSTTTSSTGAYTLALTTGGLPCVLRVTPAGGGTVLHSVAQTSGTAHLTPLSQLVVTSLAGAAPDTYYAGFDATVAAAQTATAVQAAKARVVATLKAGGADFSAFGDVITAALAVGNPFDQALDALALRMTAQALTLTALTDAVRLASPANTAPKAGTVSLPPEALLQPASPSCSALRSGVYRVIVPAIANVGEHSTETFALNAVTGVTTGTDPSDVGQITGKGNCIYDTPTGELVVSPAGVLVFRMQENGVHRLGFGFLEQTHQLADLAGSWNSLGYERNSAGTRYDPESIGATVSANGDVSVTSYCPGVLTCTPLTSPPSINFNVLPSGGFGLSNTVSQGRDPFFAYRAGNGELMLAGIAGNGSFTLWTPQRTNGLPALNAHAVTWGIWLNSQLRSTLSFTLSDFDTTALDAATMSYTRVSRTDGHSETLSVNQPRNGLYFRAEGTATATIGPTAGTTVPVREFTSLPMRGMGLSVLSMPTLFYATGVPLGGYFFSITQP